MRWPQVLRGLALLPFIFGEQVCIGEKDESGNYYCSTQVSGSALLQSKLKSSVLNLHNTSQEEDIEDAKLEKAIQHQRSLELLQTHGKVMKHGAYSAFKLTILQNYGATGCGGDTTCVQFAELNLYHGGEEISYEGATFEQGDGETSPGREQAQNAFDNNDGTKYLTRRGDDAKILTITLAEPQEIDEMSFTTANDVPDRDPKRFILEGAHGDSLLQTGTNAGTWEMLVDHSGEDLPQVDRHTETEKIPVAGGGGDAPPGDGGSGDGGSGDGGSGDGGSGDGGSGDGGSGDEGSGDGGTGEAPPGPPAKGGGGGGGGGDDPEEWVRLVNEKRAMHGACPLTWNEALADGIKEWVDGLTSLVHDESYDIPPPGGPCGENLAWASNGVTPEQSVQMWYDEVNDCATPPPGCEEPKPGKMTGHFTAMVWKGAQTMGCAISENGEYSGCRWKAGDTLSEDTPNMAMPGCYEKNVGATGEEPSGC